MACFYGLRKLGVTFACALHVGNFGLNASLIEIGRIDFTNKHLHTLSISVIYASFKAVFTPPLAVCAGRACRSKDSTWRSCVQKVRVRFTGDVGVHMFVVAEVPSPCRSCWGWWWFAILGCFFNALWITNVEAKNGGLDDFPFQRGDVQVPCSSQGCMVYMFLQSKGFRKFSVPGVPRKLWHWALQHHKLHHLWCLGERKVAIPSIPCWYVDLIYFDSICWICLSFFLCAGSWNYEICTELRTQNCCTSIVLPWLRWAPARGQVLSPNLASECWNERRACLIAPNFRHCGWPFGEVKRLKEQLREMALTPAKEIPKTDGDCLGSQKVRLTDSNYEAEQENVRYFWNMFVTVLILDIFVQNLFAQHFKQ